MTRGESTISFGLLFFDLMIFQCQVHYLRSHYSSLSWCMLLDPPLIPSNPNAKILTNSAKYAHYGTGLTNRRLRFGSMNQCIEVAKSGKMNLMNGNSHSLPHWLRSCTQGLVKSIKFVK